MDYIIYTFGGGEQLQYVLNAVGRIFASDSEYFTPVGKFAMSLGVTWTAIKAIFKADIRGFGVNWLLPSMLIFIVLFSPKATVWIKDDITQSAPIKVDNIPFGIAFFSSVASGISYSVAEILEKHLLPLEGLSMRKTGLLFGAKLVGKLPDVQIQDPIILRNTKEYMRQCFIKPYILGNLLGKKGGAQASDDIIDFLEKNPPNNFGLYYRDMNTSRNVFKTCKQTTALIKESLNKELNGELLIKFASYLGLRSGNKEQLKQRLKLITHDTLSYLKKDQADIHAWMKQAMLINANRESYDDWREKYSLQRIYPQLIAMNATRGMFQQSIGWIIAGEIFANNIPVIQSAIFSIIICLIFVVFPYTMLPGGYNILKFWLLLIVWVSSLPIFFTVTHCLGLASLSSNNSLFGSKGISLTSQGNFSEVALNTYATFQMIAASSAVLAWAVVKGCVHAATSLGNSLSPVAVATNLGSATVDNTLNVDNINHGGRSIAQQQYTPSLSMGGGVIDDGGIRITTTAQGDQIINQPVDNLPTNYRMASTMSDNIQIQLSHAQNALGSLTERYSALSSMEKRQVTDLAERFAKGEANIDGISINEQATMRAALLKGCDMRSSYNQRDGQDTSTSSNINLGFGFAGSGAQTGVSSSNTHNFTEESSLLEQKAYNEALEKVKNAARTNSINSTSDTVKSLTKGISSNINEQQLVGQDIAKTLQTIDSLQRTKTYIDGNAATIDRNFNDAVLQKVIDIHPEISNKAMAARWIASNQEEADQIARELMCIRNRLHTHNWSTNHSQEFSVVDSQMGNIYVKDHNDLKNEYDRAAQHLKQQTVIQSDTGQGISLPEYVQNAIDSKNVVHDEPDKNVTRTLNILAETGDNKMTVNRKYCENQNSTILRTLDKITDNTDDLIESIQSNADKLIDKP